MLWNDAGKAYKTDAKSEHGASHMGPESKELSCTQSIGIDVVHVCVHVTGVVGALGTIDSTVFQTGLDVLNPGAYVAVRVNVGASTVTVIAVSIVSEAAVKAVRRHVVPRRHDGSN